MDGAGGGGGAAHPSRRSMSSVPGTRRRGPSMENGHDAAASVRRASATISRTTSTVTGERTVKRLRLSKALTIPDHTSVYEACRRMAARRVDAVLLTDSNALLCGILTDKDITTRVIARELKLEDTPVSKVMTRNPLFVLGDTLAVEALQKMVQGKFRHLPVVDNGEVIALLDIAKCLYDAIARMERAAEKGKAIAAAVEGVEKHWGTSVSGPNTFVETLRERMFRPSLSTIISENSKVATVAPTDTVLTASKKMLELKVSSAVVAIENKPGGILTSRDILMRVIAHNLPPESTTVEKVMTQSPECASGSSEPPHESSSADSSCLTVTEPPAAACRPHAPVAPKVMFADWLNMDYIGAAATPGLEAAAVVGGSGAGAGASQGGSGDHHRQVVSQGSSVQVDGPPGGVEDPLHGGLGDSGSCWEFLEQFDSMDQMQAGGGFCDLLSMTEFFGLN